MPRSGKAGSTIMSQIGVLGQVISEIYRNAHIAPTPSPRLEPVRIGGNSSTGTFKQNQRRQRKTAWKRRIRRWSKK